VSHLSQEQLLAFRDGESDDPGVREHLATCPECQQAFDDSRWRLALQRLSEDGSEHPSSDRMLAYWYNALSTESARQVQRHLRGCNRCLAIYERLRAGDPKLAYASPRPALLRKVRERYVSSPRPVRELGVLWLRRLGEALGLEYSPEASVQTVGGPAARVHRAMDLLRAEATTAEGREVEAEDEAPAAHPASASARKLRMKWKRHAGEVLSFPLRQERIGEGRPSKTEIDAGGLWLAVRLAGREDGPGLVLHARFTDTDKPAGNLRVGLKPEHGARFEARTDEDGAVTLPFPEGESRLEIRGPYPVVLALRN
jgi:predicted anti-sigma-YlaC factor YlaD